MKTEKLLKTAKDRNQFKKWLVALRSGEYLQTINTLQTNTGYCCLGVACRVLIPKNKLITNSSGILKGDLPNDQPEAPIWLQTINEDYRTKTRSNAKLEVLNDVKQNTFKQIATKLERVYAKELV